jgi:carboxymethylenebutenolidase
MKRTAFPSPFALCIVALLALTVSQFQSCAQDWAKARLEASPRHREYVALKHGDRKLQAFVVYPEGEGEGARW